MCRQRVLYILNHLLTLVQHDYRYTFEVDPCLIEHQKFLVKSLKVLTIFSNQFFDILHYKLVTYKLKRVLAFINLSYYSIL